MKADTHSWEASLAPVLLLLTLPHCQLPPLTASLLWWCPHHPPAQNSAKCPSAPRKGLAPKPHFLPHQHPCLPTQPNISDGFPSTSLTCHSSCHPHPQTVCSEPFQMPSEIPSVPQTPIHPSRPGESMSGSLAHGPLPCLLCVAIYPCLVMVPPDEGPFLPHLCIICLAQSVCWVNGGPCFFISKTHGGKGTSRPPVLQGLQPPPSDFRARQEAAQVV